MQRIVLDAPQELQKINRFLREYVGFSIQLWSYSVSHSHLDLRLNRGTAGNFHLRFAAVNAIVLPQLVWQLNGQVKCQHFTFIHEYYTKKFTERDNNTPPSK